MQNQPEPARHAKPTVVDRSSRVPELLGAVRDGSRWLEPDEPNVADARIGHAHFRWGTVTGRRPAEQGTVHTYAMSSTKHRFLKGGRS